MNEKYKQEIERYRQAFQYFKRQVENEKLPCYFAEDSITQLKKQEKRLRAILQYMNVEKEVIEELNLLINETEQFLHDILDIIEIERKQF